MIQFDVYISWSSVDDELLIADLCDYLKRNGLSVYSEYIPLNNDSPVKRESCQSINTNALFFSILEHVTKNTKDNSSTVYRFT